MRSIRHIQTILPAPSAGTPVVGDFAAADTDSILDRVIADYQELMRRTADWHATEFLGIDVTMSQAKLLYLVAIEPDTRMSTLPGRLGVTLSTVSGIVDRLVEHDLVARHVDPDDRRSVMITATDQGRAVIERFRELGSRRLRSLLETLTHDELEHLRIGIAALAARAQQALPTPDALDSYERTP